MTTTEYVSDPSADESIEDSEECQSIWKQFLLVNWEDLSTGKTWDRLYNLIHAQIR